MSQCSLSNTHFTVYTEVPLETTCIFMQVQNWSQVKKGVAIVARPIKCSFNLGLVQPSTSNETRPISNQIKVVKSRISFFLIHKQQAYTFLLIKLLDKVFKSTNLLKHFDIVLFLSAFFFKQTICQRLHSSSNAT